MTTEHQHPQGTPADQQHATVPEQAGPAPTDFPKPGPEALSIATDTSTDGWTVVSVAGEIDMANSQQVEQALLEAIRNGPGRAVVVDLSQVGLMDSTGLNALLVAHQHAEVVGGLRLIGLSEPARKVLQLTELDRVFPIHTTMTELQACTACGARGAGREAHG